MKTYALPTLFRYPVFLLSMLLVLGPRGASAQIPEVGLPLGGTLTDLTVQGGFAYVAQGSRIVVYDLAAADLSPAASLSLEGAVGFGSIVEHLALESGIDAQPALLRFLRRRAQRVAA